MLHTVYSNSYEILRAYLMHSIGANNSQSALKPIRIISGSRLINNELMLSIAKEKGICAGIDFWTINNWFRNYLGYGLSEGGQSQAFIWQLWELLDDDFIQSDERLRKHFEHREKVMDRDLLRYELAKNVATVFEKYIHYRFDWVFDWTFPKETSGTVETLKEYTQKQGSYELKESNFPHLSWQKRLWEEIGKKESMTLRRTLNMFGDSNQLEKKVGSEPQELHFFVPSNVSPLMLPVLKSLADSERHDVYAYLLNPCQNYWFGSNDHSQSKVSDYLRKNAASTRATINRFNQFAREEKFNQNLPIDILTKSSLQRLGISTFSEIDRVDLAPNDDALLHDFQRSILLDNTEELPTEIDAKDRSIRFIKSPTAAREVENVVNVIHALFNDPSLPDLKADDILVVTPDIETVAPAIEATFSTLPESQRIAYKIVGQNAIDENMTGRALIELGRLFMTPMNINQLESWLELPFVTKNLKLSLEDLNIIRDWLVTAGFRQGINDEHIQNTRHIELTTENNEPHEALDGTLERALERLSWGFVLDQNERESFEDVLPVSNGVDTRFNTVNTEKRIFQTLLMLENKLKEAHRLYMELGDRANIDDIAKWAHGLIDLFFTNSSSTDKIALQSSLRVINPTSAMVSESEESTEDDQEPAMDLIISPAVYWRALEDTLGEEPTRQAISGAVTFAPLKLFRQIPFRVILAIGLNENSSFPGTQHFEEYDLMGVSELKRQDDRDSRSDNRNVFLNLALSARDRFYCSWCIGTDQKNPANPSPVVTEFMDFLASNVQSNADTPTKLKALTTQLPLSPASSRNFTNDETRYWQSVDGGLLQSLESALKTNFQSPEEPIVTGTVSVERFKGQLNIEELIAFYKSAPKWLEKQLMIKDYDDTATEEVPLIAPRDALSMTILSNQWLQAFEEGQTIDDLTVELERNPLVGAVNTRSIVYRDELQKRYDAWCAQKELLSDAQSHMFEHLAIDVHGKYFNELVANNVTLWSFDDDKDSLYYSDICLSDSGLRRAVFRVMLLRLLVNKPIGLKVYNLKNENWIKSDAPDIDISTKAFSLWFDAMEAAIRQITYIDKKPASNPKYDTEPTSIIWRGADLDAAQRRAKEAYDEFDALIKDWIKSK